MKTMILTCLAGLCLSGVAPTAAQAQRAEQIIAPVSVRPEAATLLLLQKHIPASFTETRLEEVLRFIQDATGAEIEILWTDDKHPEGFNKDTPISIESKAIPALTLIERVIQKVATSEDLSGGATWQMSESGAIQIGPKSRLNKFKRVEVYSIEDLLVEVPDFTDAPDFNLQSVLQSGQGGSQSPFQDRGGGQEGRENRQTRDEKVQEVIDLIVKIVETDQWVDNGGEGATITPFRGQLIVEAPDYVHRGIDGYPYWGSGPKAGRIGGGRWLGMSGRTSNSQVDRMTNIPISEPK